jgi:hypothetical protein
MNFEEYEKARAKKIIENQGPVLDWAETYGVNTEDFSMRYEKNGKEEVKSNTDK